MWDQRYNVSIISIAMPLAFYKVFADWISRAKENQEDVIHCVTVGYPPPLKMINYNSYENQDERNKKLKFILNWSNLKIIVRVIVLFR